MWGIRLADSVHLHDMGFIPAHAGNTVPYGHVPGLCQVHPRSRGEYLSPVFLNLLISGSSPLTRGILLHAVEISRSCRFTPAHAGNTWKYKNIRRSNQVHPRSRGEYTVTICRPFYRLGSPPLTRGIPFAKRNAPATRGFTPAHAGNTLKKALFYLTFSNTHFHISFNF